MKNAFIALACLFVLFSCQTKNNTKLDISGEWTVMLDSTDTGIRNGWNNQVFTQTIHLPGTTDDAGIGVPNKIKPSLKKECLNHLARKTSYVGAAWYTREITIPADWKEKEFILKLERVIWTTHVWVDGKEVEQTQNTLIAPHYYNLTGYIEPGATHRLTIRVDNRKQFDISYEDMAHAYTNHTQIMWNGIIGDMSIEAFDQVRITNLQVTPQTDTKDIRVKAVVQNNRPEMYKGEFKIDVIHKKSQKKIYSITEEMHIEKGESHFETSCFLGDNIKLWSEFSPEIYRLEVALTTADTYSTQSADFGMRKFSRQNSVLTINDKPLFLRGTLECNIFPLTGHPPMDKAGWEKVFGAAKSWGLNHLRFHSWCPPKAAFEVADEMGFYLQVELPVWATTIGKDKPTVDFLYDEAHHIMDEYGNHPSFCMWSLGNELQGDMDILSEMVSYLKKRDSRHLYTTTSFTFERGYGAWPEPEDDFFITQWTKKGWVRGQGVFNSEPPTFDKDYTASVEGMTVPLITHEIGQYAVYPRLDEISKYTGVLEPLNFIAIKEDLERKGLIQKAADYTLASGKLAALLYKEEIERALKTAGISGFQLLDLHDFPGQGTALVGLLDAFWDSKGIITDKEFRQFSSPVVPLLRFPKAVYTNNESFTASLDISNYWDKPLENQAITWSLSDKNNTIDSGSLKADINLGYNQQTGNLKADLSKVSQAAKLTVKVKLEGTDFENQWNIWVYPENQPVEYGNIIYTRNLEEAYKLLETGKKVLLNPDWKAINGIEGKFVPVFWSPVHFPRQAGTMGVLCNPSHKALAGFVTDMHTDWQWWDLNIHSTTLITDSIQGGTPIIEMIDNFANNRKLASLFEGSIGAGKLMITSIDLANDMENRPVARQLLISILNYMQSEYFTPEPILNPEILELVLQEKENYRKESATSIY